MKNVSSDKNKIERVMVNVRIRPFTEDEKKRDSSTPIDSLDLKNNTLQIKKDYDKKTFTYDKIYPMSSNQAEVFENSSKKVVESVLKGYNGTIFAYGQTGTGKTYTMVGDFDNPINKGIIPRAFDYIFEKVPNDKEHKYNIMVSFIQIYLETIQDLLEPKNKDIRIREDPEQGVYLDGVQWVKVTSTQELANVFHFGEKNRVTESTKMNTHSSRSHAILIARIEKSIVLSKEKISELSKESNEKIKAERVMTTSSLYLVDLAGSERVKKTKAENMRLEEAKKINYSLLVLGNCIQALTETKGKMNHIPYRDSKLTRLLQESLGGNAKTSLIVTVSPSGYNADETVSSLNFALRAMKVQNKPIINKSVDYQALSIKLQEDLDKLTDQYTMLKIEYDKVVEENRKLKNGETYVEMQRKSICNTLEDVNPEENNEERKPFSKENQKDRGPSRENSKKNVKEKENLEQEIKKLEKFYEGVLQSKTDEYENILKDIDKILLEKEGSIEKLLNENKNLHKKNDSLNDLANDLQKEKEDLMKSVTDLTNKLNYEMETSKINSSKEHKAELDKLNSTIEALEAKIIPLENMNTLNNDSVTQYQNKIDQKIKALKIEKTNLQQTKSNNVIRISQNEIKIKLNGEECDNLKKKMENVTDEMKKILHNRLFETESEAKKKQKENARLGYEQEGLTRKINLIEEEIKTYKNLKQNLTEIKNDSVSTQDKTDLFCNAKLNEVGAQIQQSKTEFTEQRLTSYEGELIKLNDEIETLTKNNEELTKKVEDAENKIKAGTKEQSGIKSEKAKIEVEMKKIMMELKFEKEKNEKMQNEKTQKSKSDSDNLKKTEEKLTQKQKEFEKEKANAVALNTSLQKLKKEMIEKETKFKEDLNQTIFKLNTAEEKLKNSEAQIETLTNELNSKQKCILESINANESVNQMIQSKDSEISKLKKENLEEKEKSDKLNQSIISLNSEISYKKKEISQLQDEIQGLKEEKEKLIEKSNESLKEISEKEQMISELNDQLMEKTNEISKTKRNNNEQQSQNDNLLKEKNELKKTNENLINVNKEMKILNDKIAKDYKDKETKLNSKIEDLNKVISQRNSEISGLSDTIFQLKDEKEKNEKEIAKLKENYSSSSKEIKEELSKKEKEIQKIKLEKDSVARELKNFKNQYDLLQVQNDEIKKNNNKLISDITFKDKEMSSIAQLNKHITEQLLVINQKDNEISSLKEDKNELSDKINEITKDNSKLKLAADKLQKDIKEKDDMLNQVKEKLKLKEKEMDRKKEQSEAIEKQMEENKIKFAELQQTLVEVQASNTKLKEEKTIQENQIETQKRELSTKEEQALTNSNEITTKITNLYSNLCNSLDNYSKYQKEIEKIQGEILKNPTKMNQININELNNLLENEDSASEEEKESKESIPIQTCVENLVKKMGESKSKFSKLISAYTVTVNSLNNCYEENNQIKNKLIENMKKILGSLSAISPSSIALVQFTQILQKKFEGLSDSKSKPTLNDFLKLEGTISSDSITELVNANNEKDSEINHLNERIEYCLKELEIVQSTNDKINQNASSTSKLQALKYESQLKLKNDEITKLNKKLDENVKLLSKSNQDMKTLKKENEEIKSKIDTQNKHIEIEEKNRAIEKSKIANKDVSTGKFLIKEFFNKTVKFSDDLYRYCCEKNAGN